MQNVLPWLTLKSVPGIGALLFSRLVRHFGSPQGVLDASESRLAGIKGIGPELAGLIHRHRSTDWAAREFETVRRKGYRIITLFDPDYPPLLRQIPDPPALLYVCGTFDPGVATIAVVGSRKATRYGLTTARSLCEGLAARGITVVSGMALGIDTAAHKGALAGGGRTLAVLGTGLDCVYPPQNGRLFREIAQQGAVMTEFALNARPEPHHFPARNRIISGICLGTVVVEAAQRSGSLITARLAAEQGREVYAVPGSIHAVNSHGTHALIKQGAKLVQDVDDIIEEIKYLASCHNVTQALHKTDQRAPPQPELSAEEAELCDALGPYPVHIDDLAHTLKQDSKHVAGLLVLLEIKGIAQRQAGNYYLRSFGFSKDFTV
jgi:DNA processing protein